jgi:hypothetical protein
MARKHLTTSLATLITAWAALATTSEAAHRRPFAGLVPVAEQLRSGVIYFEDLACQRGISHHDRHFIKQLNRNACRLAEGVATTTSLGRVKADLHRVNLFTRLVDRRVHAGQKYEDPALHEAWHRVKCDLNELELALETCNTGGIVAPPPIPEEVGRHVPSRTEWGRRPPRHQGPGIDDRYPPRGRYAQNDHDRVPRQSRSRSSGPLWLEALLSAISR